MTVTTREHGDAIELAPRIRNYAMSISITSSNFVSPVAI